MAVALPAGIAASIVVGRVLGPAGKGEFTLATLIGALLLTVLNLGIPAAISYFISGGHAPEASFVKTVVVLGGMLAALGFVLTLSLDRAGYASRLLGAPHLTPAMWLIFIGLPFQFWGTFLQFVILAQGRRVLFAALPALGQLFVTILIGVLALLGRLTPVSAVAVTVASQILTGSTLLAFSQLHLNWLRAPLLSPRFWSSAAKYSLTSYGANTLQFLIQRADVFLVSIFLGVRAVGLYSVAYGVAELLTLLPQRLNNLYVPRIAGERTPDAKRQEVPLSSSLVFVSTAAAALLLALTAPFCIRFFYGEQYAPSVAPFLLLLPGICALAASSIQTAYLSGVGRVSTNAIVAGAGLALNLLLNLVLIPRYGISGAAAASSLAYCAQALLLVQAVARLTKNRPLAMLTSAPPAVFAGYVRRAFRGVP